MNFDLVQRLVDVARLVTDNFHFQIGGKLGFDDTQPLLDAFDHRDRVGTGLADHFERQVRLAVEPRQGALLLGAVLGPADVAHANGRAVPCGNDEVVEVPRVG